MAKISDIISKYVISLYDGQVEGVVENALFNLRTKKLRYLIVYNDKTNSLFALPTNAIYSIGDGAVSIKNNSYLNLYESIELELMEFSNPINSSVFKINGDSLGIITDIETDEKYNILKLYLSDSTEINQNQIANINEKTLIVKDENSKVNVKNFSRRIKNIKQKTNDSRIVNILEINPQQEHQTRITPINQPASKKTEFTTLVPNRAIANYAFLINRKVNRNIMAQNGNLIIRQNTKINENIINIARQNGKLKELTKYST